MEKPRDDWGVDAASIQEELLASLMAGTIGPLERLQVARYLAANPEAREVLLMAHQALVTGRATRGDS